MDPQNSVIRVSYKSEAMNTGLEIAESRCDFFDVKAVSERTKGLLQTFAAYRPEVVHLDYTYDLFPSRIYPDGSLTGKEAEFLFRRLLLGIYSTDPSEQLETATLFVDMLIIDPRTPPVEQFKHLVPFIAECLLKEDNPDLQLKAAWILKKLTPETFRKESEDNTKIPIAGYASMFVDLLKSPNDIVREEALFALGIAFKRLPSCRRPLLKNGALVHLAAQVNKTQSLGMRCMASYALLRICREKSLRTAKQKKRALSALNGLVRIISVPAQSEACWALSYLIDCTDDISLVINAGFCPRLVKLLEHHSHNVVIPVLRTFGYITAGDDCQKQAVIKCGALPRLRKLLIGNPKMGVKGLVCWVIANITAGNAEQIQSVIEAELIPPLATIVQIDVFKMKKVAARAISNATSRGSRDHINYLVKQGCVKPLLVLLNCSDPGVVTVCEKGSEYFEGC